MLQLELTSKAIEKIRAFQAADTEAKSAFRIYVQGGGCSGFEYGFSLDNPGEDDLIKEEQGVKVVVDQFSAPYIENALVDYHEDFRGAGFQVKNPNAKSTCGCGQSFSV
jgi:iron-sulfur cluster insertion protein